MFHNPPNMIASTWPDEDRGSHMDSREGQSLKTKVVSIFIIPSQMLLICALNPKNGSLLLAYALLGGGYLCSGGPAGIPLHFPTLDICTDGGNFNNRPNNFSQRSVPWHVVIHSAITPPKPCCWSLSSFSNMPPSFPLYPDTRQHEQRLVFGANGRYWFLLVSLSCRWVRGVNPLCHSSLSYPCTAFPELEGLTFCCITK